MAKASATGNYRDAIGGSFVKGGRVAITLSGVLARVLSQMWLGGQNNTGVSAGVVPGLRPDIRGFCEVWGFQAT